MNLKFKNHVNRSLMVFSILPVMISFFALHPYIYGESYVNLDAQKMYENKDLVLDKGTENFIIVIPNEAHESINQPKSQLPIANQPYLPQNLIIKPGTKITWFNADVGHTHKIDVFDNKLQNIFSTGIFDFNKVSSSFEPKETGIYKYEEKNVNEIDKSFIMNGTITVEEDKSKENQTSINSNVIAGTFMIPTKLLASYEKKFQKGGFKVLSTFSFKDIRGGQKGTGPEQTYVVWSTNEKDVGKVLKFLNSITPKLPYS